MQIELTQVEANGLYTLMYSGVTMVTLKKLGIYGLLERLRSEGLASLVDGELYFENIASYETL